MSSRDLRLLTSGCHGGTAVCLAAGRIVLLHRHTSYFTTQSCQAAINTSSSCHHRLIVPLIRVHREPPVSSQLTQSKLTWAAREPKPSSNIEPVNNIMKLIAHSLLQAMSASRTWKVVYLFTYFVLTDFQELYSEEWNCGLEKQDNMEETCWFLPKKKASYSLQNDIFRWE